MELLSKKLEGEQGYFWVNMKYGVIIFIFFRIHHFSVKFPQWNRKSTPIVVGVLIIGNKSNSLLSRI